MARSTSSNVTNYEFLVMCVARGFPVSEWCRKNKTAPSTVAKWQSESEFTRDVQEHRRGLLRLAVAKFTGAVNPVAAGVIELASSALSESMKLSAQRAMMEKLVKITEFAELKRDVESKERTGIGSDGHPAGTSGAPGVEGPRPRANGQRLGGGERAWLNLLSADLLAGWGQNALKRGRKGDFWGNRLRGL